MNTTLVSFVKHHASIIRVVAGTALILAIPLIAMQLSPEVNWSPSDFILMGGLLLVAGAMLEYIGKKVKNVQHRITLSVILLLAVMYIWAELAVGIFTNLGS